MNETVHMYKQKRSKRWGDTTPTMVKQVCTSKFVEFTPMEYVGYNEPNKPASHATVFRQVTCVQCLNVDLKRIQKDFDECKQLIEKHGITV